MIPRLERALDATGRRLQHLFTRWWAWPAGLLTIGVFVMFSSAMVVPAGEDVHLLGFDLFGRCEYLDATGRPCASCGMTRSWMWSARGQILNAWSYSPAGTVLFWVASAGGVLGALRLALRRPRLLHLPWWALGAFWAAWFALYIAVGVQRIWL